MAAGVFGGTAVAQQVGAPQGGSAISSSLGVSAYPARGQTPQQQQRDEGQCYGWARQTTGIDPMAKPAAPPASTAIRPLRRAEQKEAEQQAEAKVLGQEKAQFNKAFGTCMTGRGYVTK
jgi:hypothetical protein